MNATAEQAPKALTAEERANRPWRKYRLRPIAANGLRPGRHEQVDRDGKTRSYPAGTVCENQEDLAERWPEKFEIVREETPSRPEDVLVPEGYELVKKQPAAPAAPATPQPPQTIAEVPASKFTKELLSTMSLDALKGLAADEEVAIKGFEKDKDRIVRAIVEAKG